MANPEHLELLKQGVETWNHWRIDNPDVIPDLSVANLTGTNLTGANFSRTFLYEAVLVNADLSSANISGAKLVGADLSAAKCYKANLSEASLWAARLLSTRLDGATLTGACLWETQRAGWSIAGVTCESVYWDKSGKEKSVYRSGEFEKLFNDGIDLVKFYAAPFSLNYTRDSHPVDRLHLARNGINFLALVLTITVAVAGGFIYYLKANGIDIRHLNSNRANENNLRFGNTIKARVATANLYLREGPGENYEATYLLPENWLISLLGDYRIDKKGEDWARVLVETDGGSQEGWVKRRFLEF
jgi:uncharacterized protein YjbI with pentapeptide repeats